MSEIDRVGSALECARQKCQWGMNHLNSVYGLASEGSFGPHPYIPFLARDHEILYFIGQKHGFHLHESLLSKKTNFQMQTLSSLDELIIFANKAKFPSHALIVRPNLWNNKAIILKGITSLEVLEEAFSKSIKNSDAAKIWVETDMRAYVNPSRMGVISEFAFILANRLKRYCPNCSFSG